MRPVAPRLAAIEEITVGAESETYRPLTVGLAHNVGGHRCLITRWRLSDDDRAKIADGWDVFVYVTADNLPPIFLSVGSEYHEYAGEG